MAKLINSLNQGRRNVTPGERRFAKRMEIFIVLGQIDASKEQAAQNRKLLYVDLTRAKERLLITASAKNEFTKGLESMVEPTCAFA